MFSEIHIKYPNYQYFSVVITQEFKIWHLLTISRYNFLFKRFLCTSVKLNFQYLLAVLLRNRNFCSNIHNLPNLK